eukprot:2707108-Amphidinium_carterae.1
MCGKHIVASLSRGGMHESAVHRLEAQSLHHYMRAVKRVVPGPGRISISSDAARLGDPPEETMCLQAWIGDRDVGLVLPPQ